MPHLCSNATAECFHGRQRQFGHPRDKDTEWNVDVHADEKNPGFTAVFNMAALKRE